MTRIPYQSVGSALTAIIFSFQKGKYKRKLKAVNAQLSETKHEWSLQVFELKQEISQLTEENSKLRGNTYFAMVPRPPSPY